MLRLGLRLELGLGLGSLMFIYKHFKGLKDREKLVQ